MQLVKASTATYVRFVMVDSTGAVVTSLTSGTCTVEFARSGETSLTAAAKTNFAHIGRGIYQIQLSGAEIGATLGHYVYVATGGTALQFTGELEVTANLLDDVAAFVDTVESGLATANSGITTANAGITTANSGITTANTGIATINGLVDTVETTQTTILNRIGSFTGSGVNTILGFFQALMRKSGVSAPSDLAGTYDPTKHSSEALRDAIDKSRRGMVLVSVRGTTLYLRTWLLYAGQIDATGTVSRVTVYDEDGTVKIATLTDSSPDAQGMFLLTQAGHTLVAFTNYVAKVEIDSPNGNVSTQQGFSLA